MPKGWPKGKARSQESTMKQSEAMLARWTEKQAVRGEDIVAHLREHGVLPIRELQSEYGDIQNILARYRDKLIRIHIVWCGGGHCAGGNLGGSRFIRSGYLGKTYVGCKEDRTSIVRFFMKLFRDDVTYGRYDINAITQWLRSFRLTRAERVGIVTSLGFKYRRSNYMKNIRIDGYLDNKSALSSSCLHCHAKTKEEWKFCPSCGEEL